MRSRVVVLGLGVVLAVAAAARPAQANVNAVVIQRAVVLSALKACAVQMMITGIVNNQTNGTEALLINGVKIAGIARLAALGVALSNKPFLVASPAFEAETGETADETISDTDCEKLTPGTTLDFRGSFGPIAGTATLPAGFGLNTAMLWNASGLLVDLAINSVQLLRFAAALILVGNGPLVGAAVASSGGCAHAPPADGRGSSPAAAALLGLGVVVAARTRRRRRP
jgi:MYXO-CTERM domain-containing protein